MTEVAREQSRRRILGIGLLALVVIHPMATATQPAASPSILRAQLDAVYRAYERAHNRRDVVGLIGVDRELRTLIGPSEQPWNSEDSVQLEPSLTDTRLGIGPLLFDPAYVTYSGSVLAEAHAIDPTIRRSETLFSTVSTGSWEPPPPASGRRYLREFPNGPFSSATHYSLALFYQDLFQAVTDIMRGRADFHADCYRKYVDRRPLDTQRRDALATGLRHWRELLRRYPGDVRLRQFLRSMERADASDWDGWHYCGD